MSMPRGARGYLTAFAVFVVLGLCCLARPCGAALRGQVVEGWGNENYYWYKAYFDGKAVSFPVPRGYVPMKESDDPEWYKKKVESSKRAGDTLLGLFIDSTNKCSKAYKYKNYNYIEIYYDYLTGENIFWESKFDEYKNILKERYSEVIQEANKLELKKDRGIRHGIRYLIDDSRSLSWISTTSGWGYPVHNHTVSTIRLHLSAFTVEINKYCINQQDTDDLEQETIQYIKYIENDKLVDQFIMK